MIWLDIMKYQMPEHKTNKHANKHANYFPTYQMVLPTMLYK